VVGQPGNASVPRWSCTASGLVTSQAEAEGARKSFAAPASTGASGFDVPAMNPDTLSPGGTLASSSNRPFRGRQGYKAALMCLAGYGCGCRDAGRSWMWRRALWRVSLSEP